MKYGFLKLLIITCMMTFGAHAGTYFGKVEKFDLHADKWGKYDVNDIGVLSFYIHGMPKSCNQPNR